MEGIREEKRYAQQMDVFGKRNLALKCDADMDSIEIIEIDRSLLIAKAQSTWAVLFDWPRGFFDQLGEEILRCKRNEGVQPG